jgi:nicotinamidase-related amidase
VDLEQSALLLIDFQNDFLHPEGLCHRLGLAAYAEEETEVVVENARRLIAQMKVTGRPVIWVKTVLRPDHLDSALPPGLQDLGLAANNGFLVDGSWGAEIVDAVKPEADDLVLTKKGPSAFQFTYLDRLLSNLGVTTCVAISGGPCDGLAESIRQGGALGYGMIIAGDATGYGPNSRHLGNLKNRALVTNTREILDALDGLQPVAAMRSRPALLVVDMQNDFVHADGAQHRIGLHIPLTDQQRDTIIQNNRRLVRAMHEVGNPVVFAVTTHRTDDLDSASPPIVAANLQVPPGQQQLLEGSWGAQLVDSLGLREGDFVIGKKGRSAFGFTPLHRTLRNLGVGQCIVTGGGVHGCVEDTIREGAGLGYTFTIASDAIYEPDSPNVDLLMNHARFETTDEILATLDA